MPTDSREDLTSQTPTNVFGPMSMNDAVNWLCAQELIGMGQYRNVYACGLNPRCVVKWEHSENQFCNPSEFMIWEELKDTPLRKWLAPVRAISPCGIWLLQDRCQIMEKADRPKRVPEFLSDLKAENWGMLRGHPVCFDYGNHKLFVMAAKRTKLIVPKWVR